MTMFNTISQLTFWLAKSPELAFYIRLAVALVVANQISFWVIMAVKSGGGK